MPAATSLPIWEIHDDILRTLQDGNRLVLVAPTGSGKTTQVPQMLLGAGIAGDKMIVVLQPRRVAARTVATRVASEREGKLGAEVGYQIRFDDHTSPGTRIAFVTEGILLRWLQDDRTLSNIGAVIFDEFHERNLLSDVALALVKHLQQSQRPNLAILVMSATLDAEPVAEYLSTTLEHLFNAKSKSVAAMKLVRYRDLVIEQKTQQSDLDPRASGLCLAEAYGSGAFDLPKMDHRLKQFIARVNLAHATMPELEFAPFDEAAITACLARAFTGLSLVKEAQAAPLIPAFHQHLEKGQISWLDELLPLSIKWFDKRSEKVSYVNKAPEAQVKLMDCFALEEHPTICEGQLPVVLCLSTPDGKRIASTTDWATFRARELPKHRKVLAKKFPGHMWI